MNKRQLVKLGVPEDCVNLAISIISNGRLTDALNKKQAKRDVPQIVASPETWAEHEVWGDLAQAIMGEQQAAARDKELKPINFKVWGDIDDASIAQMQLACALPMAVDAACMSDSHPGYGICIGGVVALENHVVPYMIGVDIACRMRLTIINKAPETLETEFEKYRMALEKGTLFGIAKKWQNRKSHPIMDQDWDVTGITRMLKDKAWEQLGTSGSGNHFVEFGVLDLTECDEAVLGKPGKYVALLSHSGSRNAGATVCKHYHEIAQKRLPKRYAERFRHLAWLPLDSHDGQEYWAAMNLMGEYAAANHEIIHRDVLHELNAIPLAHVENHHNFAWKETHHGREVVVHRKGATPAAEGVFGVIPGSMADPGFIVKGKGNPDSLNSASHGAGRRMSRKEAKNKFSWDIWKKELQKRGVRLLSGGIDEVPGSYKNILDVMNAQTDLVKVVGRFDPRIVKMCDDGSQSED